MSSIDEQVIQQYSALTQQAVVADLGERTCVELKGRDRYTMLNGFCTNDIKRLQPGEGCEAFLTSVQGKTLSFVRVFCQPESLMLDTEAEQANEIIPFLDRYIIREDVQLLDRSEDQGTLLVAGPLATEVLTRVLESKFAGLDKYLTGESFQSQGQPIWVWRTDYSGSPGFFVCGSRSILPELRTSLIAAGAVACSIDAVEMARLEAGTPTFGRDITLDNLPQEVDRNDLAISFTKGCYLGQETVARIDALGHVNRLLRAVRFAGDTIPAADLELHRDGKTVGRVTSAVWSPRLSSPLALAYVRRGMDVPGTVVDSDLGNAEVVAVPLDGRESP